jgi:plasmid replication initiation protein
MNNQLIKQDTIATVKQPNALTEARYDMSPLQKNMFYLLLAQLKDESLLNDELIRYKLSIKDINASRNIRVNKSELRQAARGLISSGLTIYDDSQKKLITIGILENADYGEGGDKDNLIVEFDPKLYPFLYNVKNRFTVFALQNALNLKSKYSKRIYEMLCQFKNTGIFRISVKELKERFELIDSKTGKEVYLNFGEFARRILEPAKKEINEHTDISFEYITKKTGRKITHLEFWITSKEVVKGLDESSDVDPQVAKLKDRLVTQFKLSKTLAKKIIENIPLQEIGKILYDIQVENGANNKIRKIGAYATTTFQNRLDGVSSLVEKPNSLKYTPPKMQVYNSVSQEEKLEEEENPIEYSNSFATSRSISSTSIGDLLAQIGTPKKVEQMNSTFSKEEKEAKDAKAKEKYVVWKKLHTGFRINSAEVDSLMAEYSLEKIKMAISKIEAELENQEIPQKYGHMIQLLKKHLTLA